MLLQLGSGAGVIGVRLCKCICFEIAYEVSSDQSDNRIQLSGPDGDTSRSAVIGAQCEADGFPEQVAFQSASVSIYQGPIDGADIEIQHESPYEEADSEPHESAIGDCSLDHEASVLTARALSNPKPWCVLTGRVLQLELERRQPRTEAEPRHHGGGLHWVHGLGFGDRLCVTRGRA